MPPSGLTDLHRYGFPVQRLCLSQGCDEPWETPQPAIYFPVSEDKEHLRAYLTAHGKADRYEDFAVLPTTDKTTATLSQMPTWCNETSIAAFFLPLEQACTNTPDWQLLMWEITSPAQRHPRQRPQG